MRRIVIALFLGVAVTACGGGGNSGGNKATSSGDFCSKANEADARSRAGLGALLGSDRSKAAEAVNTAVRDFDDLTAQAPAEIKSDMQTEANALRKLRDDLTRVGYDVTKLPPNATDALEGPAAQRLATYLQTKCGINPSIPSTTG